MPIRRSLLVVGISERLCALPMEDVREVALMAALSRPPGMPRLLEGLINLRGAAVPVVSLSRMFGLPEKPAGLYSSLVILGYNDQPLAFLVDYVSQVLAVSDDTLLPVREQHSFNDCAEAEALADGRVIHLLSPRRLLLEQERQCIGEFQGMEQRRLQDLEARPA